MTIDVVSVYVAFLVAYNLAKTLDGDVVESALMGVMSFLILTPMTISEGFKGFDLGSLGSGGMFVAMFGGLLGARLFISFTNKNWVIKMPDSVPPSVSKSFAAIVPGVLVAFIIAIISVGMTFTSFGSLQELIYAFVQIPINSLGANIIAGMIIVAFIELLWFFGIHGVLAVYPILMLAFYEPQLANLAAYGAGEALPHLWTMQFLLGNRGARSFAVVILLLTIARSERMKAVGKVGLIPSIFSISEPVKFGIPQVMNIRMLVPLMLTPAVSLLIAWLLTIVGFLPYNNGVSIPTAFPVVLGGFINYGWRGIVSQLLQLIACVVIYIPFIKSQDNEYLEDEKVQAEKLSKPKEKELEATA